MEGYTRLCINARIGNALNSACGVKRLLDRFTFLLADCDGELFFKPCDDASPS
jgi:hypothetical protein